MQDAALSQALAEKFQKQFIDKAVQLLAFYQQEGALVNWPLTRILRYLFGTILSYLLPVVLGMQSDFDLETAVSEAVAFLERGLHA